MNKTFSVQKITAEWITQEKFKPYGQLITASAEHKPYNSSDAQLSLQNGIPRFYIMRLSHRGRKFHQITRHLQCTQCLGSLAGKDWLIAVAPPSDSEEPTISEIRAFRIPGNCFIKLEQGTWHAGPYFNHDFVEFYNLELSDTNELDHFSHNFRDSHNLEFEIL